jgi:hypothetical protein
VNRSGVPSISATEVKIAKVKEIVTENPHSTLIEIAAELSSISHSAIMVNKFLTKHSTNTILWKEKEKKKERKLIYWTAHTSKTDTGVTKNRSKYITNFTLDTAIHGKCSPNGPCLSLCFCGTRGIKECRKSAVFMTGPK